MSTVKDTLKHCSNEELVGVWMNAARDTMDAKYRQLRREGGWFAEKSARALNTTLNKIQMAECLLIKIRMDFSFSLDRSQPFECEWTTETSITNYT